MGYRAVHHVNFNKKLYEPGAAITFGEGDEKARADLLAAGAILAGKGASAAPDSSGDGADEKPLGKLNKAELTAIAEAEGVTIAEGETNKAIVQAIEAARAGKGEG